jgi:radical SAM protein with 4Fe4S-binding SPASM domain
MSKIEDLNKLSQYRNDVLMEQPQLKNLFLELTTQCNLHCIHCGSSCDSTLPQSSLTLQNYKDFLNQVQKDFNVDDMMLSLTGGEPMLNKDFYEIATYVNNLGFKWGMTTNGTLIDNKATALKLVQAGLKSVSISIDGLREVHDEFRQQKGAFEKAINAVFCLLRTNKIRSIQITTVVTHKTIHHLEEMFNTFKYINIDSWRIINIEPIGRAKEHPELMLTEDDYRYLFDFIKEKREQRWSVTYGCSHYLGLDYEVEVRDWYYLCNAGIYNASITSTGDIVACLDIERRPELIQGNILTDDFKDVFFNKFKEYRSDDYRKNTKCSNCEQQSYCHNGAFHSYDFDNKQQLMCFKGILF